VSVTEPSYAVKRRNGKQTGGRRPQVALWLVLAWLDRVIPHTYTSIKMEQTECSETSAYKIQMPENYPEESVQYNFDMIGVIFRKKVWFRQRYCTDIWNTLADVIHVK
jgi:hypothetical protein